ncbi:hypothetical protein OIDMADRAFT_174008 [Oidiodendron maius Zn]|uniref:Uncharacterized protein n=1 Tax=Oidiodendron maius (strain Zn) TaxID=913774 RepID=A0A0C3HX93_OIDMZ|nr:hypothetical protein OIDMADRAFT_174008 [Oidiodendron maius Zn]
MAAKSDVTESVADLESLYNVEASFEYTGRDSLVPALRAFPETKDIILDHTVLITKFPLQLFNIEDGDIAVIPFHGKALYFRDRRILIFTMKGSPHEILSRAIHDLLRAKLRKMYCHEDLIASGGVIESLGNVNKQPDQSWGPKGVEYPTCVLEVGMEERESIPALDRDAQRWIENEPSHVTQVITAKIFPHRPEIIFALWQAKSHRQPVKKDEVHVKIRQGQPRASNNRSLSVIFEKLFERLPIPGSSESDVIFTAPELCSIALEVWEEIDLNRRG